MNTRRLGMILFVAMILHTVGGCALFEEEKDLPAGRRVRVVVFPVRSLQFQEVKSRQELENLNLSGSMKNVSNYAVANIRLRGEIHYALQRPSEENEVRQVITTDWFVTPLEPSLLQPTETGTFSFDLTVEHTVSHIELHVVSEPFVPSQF